MDVKKIRSFVFSDGLSEKVKMKFMILNSFLTSIMIVRSALAFHQGRQCLVRSTSFLTSMHYSKMKIGSKTMVMWGEQPPAQGNPRKESTTRNEPTPNRQSESSWGGSQNRQFRSGGDGVAGGGGGWDDFMPEAGRDQISRQKDGFATRKPRISTRTASARKDEPRKQYGGKSNERTSRKKYRGDLNERTIRKDYVDSVDQTPRYGDSSERTLRYNNKQAVPPEGKTNMRAIEEAGYDHLYGIAPILNALVANRRDFIPQDVEDENLKPEAQLTPYLFVLDSSAGSSKRDASKQRAVSEILELAERRGIPTANVDKGVLNTLSGNRPHQGLVLRCGNLELETLPADHDTSAQPQPKLWLALDEVVDPQNFGALIRSAYFMGNVGILVCAKNSAPPSPVVSAASAGALEVAQVFETTNLPRTLQRFNEDGWRILGAAAALPNDADENVEIYNLQELTTATTNQPTVLVLGSEGKGLRRLVAKSCTGFVRIPGGITGNTDDKGSSMAGVDSLNVSVTGGIMLWQFLHSNSQ